jgi:hypothetical protein
MGGGLLIRKPSLNWLTRSSVARGGDGSLPLISLVCVHRSYLQLFFRKKIILFAVAAISEEQVLRHFRSISSTTTGRCELKAMDLERNRTTVLLFL